MNFNLSGVKFIILKMIMTFLKNKPRLIFVPAAAVKRRGRALSRIIGRKEFVGGFYRLKKKVLGYTEQFL
jgi:hypothetical protein